MASAEALDIRHIASLYRVIDLIHSMVTAPSVWPVLNSEFVRLCAIFSENELSSLASLERCIAEQHGCAAQRASDEGGSRTVPNDDALKQLASLLPGTPRGVSDRSGVATVLRRIIEPVVVHAMNDRHALMKGGITFVDPPCGTHCSQGVLSFDSAGRCVFRNRAASRILKLTVSDEQTLDWRYLPRPLSALVERFRTSEWTVDSSLPMTTFNIQRQTIECVPLIRANELGGRPVLHLLVQPQPQNDTLVERLSVAARLSPREKLVARAILEGKSTTEIGAEIGLSAHTVRTYIERIYLKTNVNGRQELVKVMMSLARHGEFP